MLLALPLIFSASPSQLFPVPPFAAFRFLFFAPLQLSEPPGVAFQPQHEVALPLVDAVRDVFSQALAAVAFAAAAIVVAVAIVAVAFFAVAFSAVAVVAAAVLISFVAAVDLLAENLCVAAALVVYFEKLASNLEKVQLIVQTVHYSFLDALVSLA